MMSFTRPRAFVNATGSRLANLVNSIGFMVEISRTSFDGVKLNQRSHHWGHHPV